MIVKKADVNYLEDIFKIEKNVFAHPWSVENIENLLKDKKSAVFVAVSDNKVCGYCGVNTILDEGYITNIAVLPDYRRKGIGNELLNTLCSFAKEKKLSFLTLEVRKSNIPAISLYKKYGFEQAGERKNYYTSPVENALLFTKYF